MNYVKVKDTLGRVQYQEPFDIRTPYYKTVEAAYRYLGHLSEIDLTEKTLSKIQIPEADLSRASLDGATLHLANLYSCDFTDASLANADISGANITFANFQGADLEGLSATGTGLVMLNSLESSWICIDTVNQVIYRPSGATLARELSVKDFPTSYKVIRAVLDTASLATFNFNL